MSTYYLIRHGKKQLTPGDPPLSQEGLIEASLTAGFLNKKKISGIFSSPQRRAFQTASLIADRHKLAVKQDERLRERMNWGDVRDQKFSDFLKIWDQTNENRKFTPIHGRSSFQTGLDFQRFVEDIDTVNPDSEVAIVTHGGTIADFILNVFSINEIEAIQPNFLKQKSSFIKECSITIVTLTQGHFSLKKIATTDHL